MAVRLHVSADQRYELFLDGQRIGRGPERGDLRNWFYESHELALSAGQHVLSARCWWLSASAPAPEAQQTVRPGFLLFAEGDANLLLSTGVAEWQIKTINGYDLVDVNRMGTYVATGARLHVRGAALNFDPANLTDETGWESPRVIAQASLLAQRWESDPYWMLRSAMLPPMLEEPTRTGVARNVAAVQGPETWLVPVDESQHLAAEATGWNDLLARGTPLMVPPHTQRRIIVDLGDYYCGYTQLRAAGAGATVRLSFAESLFEADPQASDLRLSRNKGDRDEIEGKHLFGIGDTYETAAAQRLYEPHWWLAGRYVEVYVRTGEAPLTISDLSLLATHFPYESMPVFEASDPRLQRVIPIAMRVMQMCSHETSMDCPYYEQLNYVGDTRLQSLFALTTQQDDRLVRKCIQLFDWSRWNDGFTMSRYPTRTVQTIPTFSLWWVMLVHDYAMYRHDPEFLAQRMAGVRAVMERWRQQIGKNGLVESPRGWNFVDWVPSWPKGMAPGAEHGRSAIIQWQLAMAMSVASELERLAGEPALAERNNQSAWQLADAAQEYYWDTQRLLFADEPSHSHYSEHAQCLAILSGMLPDSQVRAIAGGLATSPDLARTTVYFSHYFFEACRRTGRIDQLLRRLELWFELEKLGFKTTFESPEPSRSDCHAWGAHPVFHYYATILGVRPAAPGFARVRIQPQLGSLESAAGQMPHPAGTISVQVQRQGQRLSGTVDLPRGIKGELVANGRIIQISRGHCSF